MMDLLRSRRSARIAIPGRRLAAAVACVILLATSAHATKIITKPGVEGEFWLSVSGSQGFENTTMTLICAPAKGEYGLVLVSPEVGVASADAEVTLTAGRERIGTRRFDHFRGALILTENGDPGRSLVDRASAAPDLTAGVSSRRIAFVLSDGAGQVAEFRNHCGFAGN